jgi:hypothetical protein
MIRLASGYYQDLWLGQILAVAKRGYRWECQWERNGAWIGGFTSKSKAAAYARYMISLKQREAKERSRNT